MFNYFDLYATLIMKTLLTRRMTYKYINGIDESSPILRNSPKLKSLCVLLEIPEIIPNINEILYFFETGMHKHNTNATPSNRTEKYGP